MHRTIDGPMPLPSNMPCSRWRWSVCKRGARQDQRAHSLDDYIAQQGPGGQQQARDDNVSVELVLGEPRQAGPMVGIV